MNGGISYLYLGLWPTDRVLYLVSLLQDSVTVCKNPAQFRGRYEHVE